MLQTNKQKQRDNRNSPHSLLMKQNEYTFCFVHAPFFNHTVVFNKLNSNLQQSRWLAAATNLVSLSPSLSLNTPNIDSMKTFPASPSKRFQDAMYLSYWCLSYFSLFFSQHRHFPFASSQRILHSQSVHPTTNTIKTKTWSANTNGE